MKATGSVGPAWWGKFAMQPHRENPPRTQCNGCAGGGDLNGLTCRECGGRGYFDAAHPQRSNDSDD
jgi:hypothetical protein